MGVVREFTCPSCHRSWKVFTGQGMMHSSLSAAAKTFPPDMQKQILMKAREGEPLFLFQFQQAVCGYCGSVEAVPILHFPESEETLTGPCPQCGGEARIIHEGSFVTCPQCGEGILEEKETGHWD